MSTISRNGRMKLDSTYLTNGSEVRQSVIPVPRNKIEQADSIEAQIYTKTRRKQEQKVTRDGYNVVLTRTEQSNFIIARGYMNRNL